MRTRVLCAPVDSAYLNRPPNLRNNSDNRQPCPCGRSCPALQAGVATAVPPALVISSSEGCFERTYGELRRAGFTHATRVPPVFVGEAELAKQCCGGRKCGQGRRQKPSYLARMEGVLHAHRAAWLATVRAGVPHAIFEDDIELLGSEEDVAYAVGRCAVQRCGLNFLGVGMDYLLAHAYVATPEAAALLLRSMGGTGLHDGGGLCHWSRGGEQCARAMPSPEPSTRRAALTPCPAHAGAQRARLPAAEALPRVRRRVEPGRLKEASPAVDRGSSFAPAGGACTAPSLRVDCMSCIVRARE